MQQVSLGHHFGFDLTAATKWESLGQCSINPSDRYWLQTRVDLKECFKELQLGAISQQLCTPQIPPAGTEPRGMAIAALETCTAVLWLLDMQKLAQGCTFSVGRRFIPPAGSCRICA